MAIAGTAIRPQWANNAGRAVETCISIDHTTQLPCQGCSPWQRYKRMAHTNTHYNQKSCTESPEIHHSTPSTFHKIIRVRTSSTYPVRQRCEDVCGYDKQSQVAVEEGRGQDDEEESYGENLGRGRVSQPESSSRICGWKKGRGRRDLGIQRTRR